MDAKTDAATAVLDDDEVRRAFARLAHRVSLDCAGLGLEKSALVADDFYAVLQRGTPESTDRGSSALAVTREIIRALAASRATSEPTKNYLAEMLDLSLALGAVHKALDPEADADGVPYRETMELAKRAGIELAELKQLTAEVEAGRRFLHAYQTLRATPTGSRISRCITEFDDALAAFDSAIKTNSTDSSLIPASAPHTGGRTT